MTFEIWGPGARAEGSAATALLLLLALPAVLVEASVCYGAQVSTFPWCSGYEAAGYSCAGSDDQR